MLSEIAAIVSGYLLGSIPSAYIITKLISNRDIRFTGSGNVGIMNTYRTAGFLPSLIVFVLDIGKASLAVVIASLILKLAPLFVLLAALACVAGHLWMIFLKFRGGRGMASVFGVVITMFVLYNLWNALFFFLGLIIIPLLITRNVAFSFFIAILFLPLLAWLLIGSWEATIMAICLGLLVGGKFYSTFRNNLTQSGSLKALITRKKRI